MTLEGLIQRICQAATDGGVTAVKEEVERAVASPADLRLAVPEPTLPVIEPMFSSDELTIMNVVWGPRAYLQPHDHRMWACIGIYGGREDNQLYRRNDLGIVSSGGRSVDAGDTIVLGKSAIHSVHNPLARLTGAIHVYGGPFLTESRSEWDIESMVERPLDSESVRKRFEEQRRFMASAT